MQHYYTILALIMRILSYFVTGLYFLLLPFYLYIYIYILCINPYIPLILHLTLSCSYILPIYYLQIPIIILFLHYIYTYNLRIYYLNITYCQVEDEWMLPIAEDCSELPSVIFLVRPRFVRSTIAVSQVPWSKLCVRGKKLK